MKVTAPQLEAAVAAHRKARGGEKSTYAERAAEARKNWRQQKKALKDTIDLYRAKLHEARAAYNRAKSEAEAKIAFWEEKITPHSDPNLPRFTDEIKILAYTSSQTGASDSTIRVALGCATIQQARQIIEQGKQLKEEEW